VNAACQAQGQVVGFAAGAGKHGLIAGHGQRGKQALGVIDNAVVQITGMGIEHGRLAGNGRHHLRVAMAHRGHIVIHVQIGLAVRVVQPHPFRPHHMQGLLVEQAVSLAQRLLATPDQRLFALGSPSGRGRVKGVHHALIGRVHACPFVRHSRYR
jgi:hypothetical protein